MNDYLDLKDHIDQAFAGEPMLPAAAGRLRAGQRARRVRRTTSIAATTAVVAASIAGWGMWPGIGSSADGGFSNSPSRGKGSLPTDAELIDACRQAGPADDAAKSLLFDAGKAGIVAKVVDKNNRRVYFESADEMHWGMCDAGSAPPSMHVYEIRPERREFQLDLAWGLDQATLETKLDERVANVRIRYVDGYQHSEGTNRGWVAMVHRFANPLTNPQASPFEQVTFFDAQDKVIADWVNAEIAGVKATPGVPDVNAYLGQEDKEIGAEQPEATMPSNQGPSLAQRVAESDVVPPASVPEAARFIYIACVDPELVAGLGSSLEALSGDGLPELMAWSKAGKVAMLRSPDKKYLAVCQPHEMGSQLMVRPTAGKSSFQSYNLAHGSTCRRGKKACATWFVRWPERVDPRVAEVVVTTVDGKVHRIRTNQGYFTFYATGQTPDGRDVDDQGLGWEEITSVVFKDDSGRELGRSAPGTSGETLGELGHVPGFPSLIDFTDERL